MPLFRWSNKSSRLQARGFVQTMLSEKCSQTPVTSPPLRRRRYLVPQPGRALATVEAATGRPGLEHTVTLSEAPGEGGGVPRNVSLPKLSMAPRLETQRKQSAPGPRRPHYEERPRAGQGRAGHGEPPRPGPAPLCGTGAGGSARLALGAGRLQPPCPPQPPLPTTACNHTHAQRQACTRTSQPTASACTSRKACPTFGSTRPAPFLGSQPIASALQAWGRGQKTKQDGTRWAGQNSQTKSGGSRCRGLRLAAGEFTSL